MEGRLKGKRANNRCIAAIGRAIAEAFIAQGVDVFITPRMDEAAARAVTAFAGGLEQRASLMLMDVASCTVDALFETARANIGPIDIRNCALELAPYGIRVNTISPGLTATNGNANQWRNAPEVWQNRKKDIPMQRAGIPSDMTGAAILLASYEASWMTGADLIIDGGYSCV